MPHSFVRQTQALTLLLPEPFLFGLDPLPCAFGRTSVLRVLVPEHVRVAPDHLRGDRLNDVPKLEVAALRCQLRVVDDLQEHISQLIAQVRHVAPFDRVNDLVRFLDRVGNDRLMRLHDVPGAAVVRITKRLHDLNEALNVAGRDHDRSADRLMTSVA